MKQFNQGDKVKFNLDGSSSAYGEGLILQSFPDYVTIKLTKQCKEFEIGTVILVSYSEINK